MDDRSYFHGTCDLIRPVWMSYCIRNDTSRTVLVNIVTLIVTSVYLQFFHEKFLDNKWWKRATVADVQSEIKKHPNVNKITTINGNNNCCIPLMVAAANTPYPEVIKDLIGYIK